jgi:hypothetical protein
MMELNRNCLSDMVYIFGFGGDDTGILELDAMSLIDAVPSHS